MWWCPCERLCFNIFVSRRLNQKYVYTSIKILWNGVESMNLALLNGRIVEALHSVKGENYICPSCGEDVFLKCGTHNVSHFSHYAKSDCAGCDMTTTHKYAEQILADSIGKSLMLKPIYTAIANVKCNNKLEPYTYKIDEEMERLHYWGERFNLNKRKVGLFEGKRIEIQETKLEPFYQTFRPDVELISTTGSRLFVEIRVRHAVDDEKLKKLIAYKVPTIEINLSFLEDLFREGKIESLDLQEMINEILFTDKIFEYTKWLVTPPFNLDEIDFKINNIINSIAFNYIKFRQKFKWIIYGPSEFDTKSAEDWLVSITQNINGALGCDLAYELYHSSHLKKKFVYFRVNHTEGIYNLYETNEFYRKQIADTVVDKGYIIQNGSLVCTATGEFAEYTRANKIRFEQMASN